MDKYLLVISKDYWGTSTSQSVASRFKNEVKMLVGLLDENIKTLFGNEVTVFNVKGAIYDVVKSALTLEGQYARLYIYMNGHGNQVMDTSGDEIDGMDEIYQLPDGNVVDDDITDTINRAVMDSCSDKRLLVILISDHCSSGSMIDKVDVKYDWISIGSSLDNQDSYVTGDGNVMTNVFLSVMGKCDSNISVIDFYKSLDEEMRGSFIGDIQICTLHVSSDVLLEEILFK